MPKVLVFEIGSSFGYFRKSFTTTSGLTHAVIPRSSIEGLIAAILGLPRDLYPEKLHTSEIAVEVRSPIRKINIQYKHMNPKWWDQYLYRYLHGLSRPVYNAEQQISVPASAEFLVNPKYRIYIIHEKIQSDLLQALRKKRTCYTPYMGTSSMICYTKYIDEADFQPISSNDYLPVRSIIPFSEKIPSIKLEKGLRYAIEEGLPVHIDKSRKSLGTYKVVYSPSGTYIPVRDSEVAQVNMKEGAAYVKFLPTQIT